MLETLRTRSIHATDVQAIAEGSAIQRLLAMVPRRERHHSAILWNANPVHVSRTWWTEIQKRAEELRARFTARNFTRKIRRSLKRGGR